MAATSYRYLVNLPGVCQGKTIVEGTRIGVHDVVGLIIVAEQMRRREPVKFLSNDNYNSFSGDSYFSRSK
jgi:hypothetical protein